MYLYLKRSTLSLRSLFPRKYINKHADLKQ